MPTRNRRRFVSQAIWYFLRQDYSPRELVIVDDGEDSVADLVPGDARVRYIRPEGRLSLGARRNLACEHAMGEYIAHWDDDAWYSPHRLLAQVARLRDTGAAVSGLREVRRYEPRTGRLWHYAAPGDPRATLDGGSLLYRRACWESRHFPDVFAGDVRGFLDAVPDDQIDALDGSTLAVALVHGGSGSAPNEADPRWQRRPFAELSRLLDLDLAFYTGPGAGAACRERPGPAPITLAATFMVYDGYGSMAEYLALGMARAGVDVRIAPFRIDPTATSEEFRRLLQRSRPDPEGVVICHAWWGENLARFGSARELFIKTVWESSRLPQDWPARLNRATAVIVPSRFAARTFRESGVTVPVEVVYEGIDPDVYRYRERPERAGLTTLIVGVLAPRKNIQEGVAAWKLAFADDPQARLIIKARYQLDRYLPDDPRIRVVDNSEPTRGIGHWYEQADVLLALGNEGFGLPLIEGMATGLPVVALNAEAQAEVCEEAAGMVLPVRPARWQPVVGAPFGPCGVRAIPCVEATARQLRWVAEHRREAREMGRRASVWARERRNVWEMGPAMVDVVERHMRSPRPVRREHALWSPAGPRGGDVALYAEQLARAAPLARLHERPPAVWRSQVLHVQQTPDCDDEELIRQAQRAREYGIPVAITEHEIDGSAHPWEQHADLLVALTARGEERLRARWPSKRVAMIAPGCLPWRAPHRDAPDRTLAVIGPFSRPRGGWPVLDALRALPGAELLIFGPCGAEDDRELLEAARALPVRRTEMPASAEELARRLGQEAGVVVFWHDDAPHATTSHAARVALASGAPVLTSRAGQFLDLAPASYQPEDLASGLEELLTRPGLRAELAGAARAFCEETSWSGVAAQHAALWRAL
jgi:glycosyltransferase involved in cell wall biosynthesis